MTSQMLGDHATHLQGWIKKPIAQNSVWKCLYANNIIEGINKKDND